MCAHTIYAGRRRGSVSDVSDPRDNGKRLRAGGRPALNKMKTSTVNAIKTLLRMDPTVTPDVRMAVIDAISGDRQESSELDLSSDVSIADAANYLSMSRTTLWRMCTRGDVVAVRRGKKFYIAGVEVVRLKTKAA